MEFYDLLFHKSFREYLPCSLKRSWYWRWKYYISILIDSEDFCCCCCCFNVGQKYGSIGGVIVQHTQSPGLPSSPVHKLGTVISPVKPALRRWGQEEKGDEVILHHIESSRPAWNTWHLSQKKKKTLFFFKLVKRPRSNGQPKLHSELEAGLRRLHETLSKMEWNVN